MSAPHALVIGVTGQDGAYLARLLLEKGYRVTGTSRDAARHPATSLERVGVLDRVTRVSMSPTDPHSVLQVLGETQPDEIYNLAGQSSVGLSFAQPVETWESNARGVLNVLEALRTLDSGARLYNAASGDCFGDTAGRAADERTAFAPRSPYAVAKAAAFWAVANYREAYGLFACSGLLFNHESPLRPDRFVTRKVVQGACRIAAGEAMRLSLGDLSIVRDWGWAPEYVDAMWRMLQREDARDYVIATGEANSLQDFVEAVFASLDLDWRNHVDHDPGLLRPSDIRYGCGNATRAAEELGWRASARMRDVASRMVAAEQGVA